MVNHIYTIAGWEGGKLFPTNVVVLRNHHTLEVYSDL
jgi:hypothetical protein